MTQDELFRNEGYWLVTHQNEFFGAIRAYQVEHGLNLGEVANHLGKSKSRISQILNGDFNPKISTLINYSLDLGFAPILSFIPINDYIDGEKNRVKRKKERREELLKGTKVVRRPSDYEFGIGVILPPSVGKMDLPYEE